MILKSFLYALALMLFAILLIEGMITFTAMASGQTNIFTQFQHDLSGIYPAIVLLLLVVWFMSYRMIKNGYLK